MRRSSKSAPAPRLPAELWLLIFEFITGPSTDPAEYCNPLNFPHVHRHLRFPRNFPAIISPAVRDLRLVCWYFAALLQPPQSFYMSGSNAAIPALTRIVHILSQRNPQACLQRLLTHPPISNRIVVLNLLGYEDATQSPAAAFDFLYDNAGSLLAVRALALCVRMIRVSNTFIPDFWGRLNKSFPSLTYLMLRGYLETSHPDASVEFENLQVLDCDIPDPHFSLQFPHLLHVSFGNLCHFVPARWPHLKSLVLRNVDRGARFEWREFPNLRLLGLPAQRIDAFPPLPSDHPLQHLYVSVGTRPGEDHNQHPSSYERGLEWLKETTERMPTIKRLSLWFDKRGHNRLNWISGYFREEDLELLGFTQRDLPYTDYENGYHSVLQRVKVEPPPEAETITSGEPITQCRGFHVGWNKFIQATSRRLHL